MAVEVSKFILVYTLILGVKSTETDIAGSPRNLTAGCVSDSSVFLIWYRPNLPDGAIKNYSVSYYLVNKESSEGSTTISIDEGNETTSSVDIDNLMPNTEYHIAVTAYTSVGPGGVANLAVNTTSTEKGAVVDDQCDHNEQCNNSGALAGLCTLIVILLVGLTISVVMNMWWCFRDGRSVEMKSEQDNSKKTIAGRLHEIRNPLFEMLKVKTKQRSDAPSNSTIKMDNNQQEMKETDEPYYDDIVEISKKEKSCKNTNHAKRAVNPYLDVAKVDADLQKVKELPELAYNITQITNQKSCDKPVDNAINDDN